MLSRLRQQRFSGVLVVGAIALGSLTLTPAPADAATTYTCNRTYYSGTALTAYGDTGSRVIEAQCRLVHYGRLRAGDVDGIFGTKTRAAVISFQDGLKRHSACGRNVTVDGIVGPVTWNFLRYGCG
ncbi:peptidoglycan-binding domain-containing protein [Streptomyces roseoviridis]|uniref:Peptidoglycan-binding domain-containing protein n=1 Tax=Streptomyces roseoviridis TaxID=67361 RepID=A0ABV5QWG7_9ACTN